MVKMIEIKLSQGAKPGHGGVLPGPKVTPEIAEARGVPVGVDCISPAAHSSFSTPVELLQFVQKLRELSQGKPVGFKLCIGHPWEWFGIAKAMQETGIRFDWQLRNARNRAKRWRADRLALAVVGLADLDVAVKGGLRDDVGGDAMERETKAFLERLRSQAKIIYQ